MKTQIYPLEKLSVVTEPDYLIANQLNNSRQDKMDDYELSCIQDIIHAYNTNGYTEYSNLETLHELKYKLL